MFMMCQSIGLPPISTIGFGRATVSSDSREPRPPARMTAFIVHPPLTPRTGAELGPRARRHEPLGWRWRDVLIASHRLHLARLGRLARRAAPRTRLQP